MVQTTAGFFPFFSVSVCIEGSPHCQIFKKPLFSFASGKLTERDTKQQQVIQGHTCFVVLVKLKEFPAVGTDIRARVSLKRHLALSHSR